jgi:hypothetical protein
VLSSFAFEFISRHYNVAGGSGELSFELAVHWVWPGINVSSTSMTLCSECTLVAYFTPPTPR